MFQAKDIMTSPVISIDPEKSVFYAAEYMRKNQLGGLPVIENGNLVGIITSRDIRLSHPNRLVADAMTKRVFSCAPSDTVWDVAMVMDKHRVERLPVVKNSTVIGIITKTQIQKKMGQMYDPLTDIYNSAYIYQVATRLLTEGHEICVILFDVNNFGKINKKFGHVYGDSCLKEISKVLHEYTDDECDFICRYGGDEFVVVTLNKISAAKQLAAKIIDKIAFHTSKVGVPVTVSAGICGGHRKYARDYNNQYKVIENLINKASLASTQAKTLNKKYIIY
ncbi:GGDEF domain-containing protein [Desulfoscipio geothermicus]|uniref:Diguanylate cyclase (GGDEF) domain-containing protein n=1 Tax=Desulfoscipio geothermicus DSM 3669 TaxID=1121426 RepID=A0A1I6DPF6_9FIRM|nr:GGDEF domain-containing protein [Desulfoscipio geothermicus]SFR07238.1 diguanylate cyclase (GGDEF) domain-containing protein [Desulfoscipio geothermicus DSM 3669]